MSDDPAEPRTPVKQYASTRHSAVEQLLRSVDRLSSPRKRKYTRRDSVQALLDSGEPDLFCIYKVDPAATLGWLGEGGTRLTTGSPQR